MRFLCVFSLLVDLLYRYGYGLAHDPSINRNINIHMDISCINILHIEKLIIRISSTYYIFIFIFYLKATQDHKIFVGATVVDISDNVLFGTYYIDKFGLFLKWYHKLEYPQNMN